MLSDDEPDPLNHLNTLIQKVDKNIAETNRYKRNIKKVSSASTANFSHNGSTLLQDDFQKFDNSVQKYVKDVKSCTGLDEIPASHVMMTLCRDNLGTLKRKKILRRRRKKSPIPSNEMPGCPTENNETTIEQVLQASQEEEKEDNHYEEDLELVRIKQEELERRSKEREAAHAAWCDRKEKEKKKMLELQAEKTREEQNKQKEMEEKRKKEQECVFKSWVRQKRELERVSQLVLESRKKEEEKIEKEKKLKETKASQEATKLWKEKKALEEKKLKEAKMQQLEQEEKLREERKRLAEDKFNIWQSTAHLKPKPTPSGMGLASYKHNNVGWINPKPWKNLDDS